MADYFSPGVYVEEFDSGTKAMTGVSTSTAGFIGMTERGPTEGRPVLITSLGDFQRVFGGYLSLQDYGPNCYLPYAVESFFANGGSACYVMRVADANSVKAGKDIPLVKEESENEEAESKGWISISAVNAGQWGNKITVSFGKNLVCKTTVSNFAVIDESKKQYALTVKQPSGYTAGDMLQLTRKGDEKTEVSYMLIDRVDGNLLNITSHITLTQEAVCDSSAIPSKFIQLYAFSIKASDGSQSEDYDTAVLNAASPNYIGKLTEKSKLVTVLAGMKKTPEDEKLTEPIQYDLSTDLLGQLSSADCQSDGEVKSCVLTGGQDVATSKSLEPALLSSSEKDFPGKRIGLDAFKELKDVSIMAIPGHQSDAVQAALITHCELHANRIAILDAGCGENEVAQLTLYKDKIDSTFAALYHPWLSVYSAMEKKNIYIPPSGAAAGIYARTDSTRGVWKAPANEVVRNCTGLSVIFNETEQGFLNPKGINLIRALPGQGIRIWGARTLSSDGNWKYVNVRRLFIYVEESIRNSMTWVVFEPNDANLWSRVQGTIKVFLTTLWRNGALVGNTAEEAFYVNVGKGTTMTDDDINNGRLICEIGIAPVKPAEFVIFRITQKMQDAE